MKIRPTFSAPILMMIVLALKVSVQYVDFLSVGLTADPYLTYGLVLMIVFALPCVIYCRICGREYVRRLRLRPFKIDLIILLLTAALAMELGSLALNLFAAKIADNPNTVLEKIVPFSVPGAPKVSEVIVFCLLPAVVEEFLFRAILCADYENVSAPWAVLIGALFFGSFQLNIEHFLSAFYCGMILAMTLYATRSLIAPILVHMIHNIAGYFGRDYMLRASNITGGRGIMLLLVVFALMFLCLGVFVWEWQGAYTMYAQTGVRAEYARRNRPASVPRSYLIQALVAPPFIVYWLLLLAYAVWRILL